MATIVKDTDTTIEITLKDELGAVIDLSTLSGYVVEVFQENCLFDQFSKNVQVGYRAVTETDAANGVFEIYLNASNTVKGQVGRPVFYEVKTLAINANFDSGTEEKSTGRILLGTLQATDTKAQTFS
jgi:hypothetical protein